jgi:hypothetical protein
MELASSEIQRDSKIFLTIHAQKVSTASVIEEVLLSGQRGD